MKQLSIWTRSLLLLCFIVFCSSNGWAWSDFALKGDFSGWNPIYLTKDNDNDNHFTGTIDASLWENNRIYQFKFYNEENGGATKNHWGTDFWNIDFSSNSTCTIDEGTNNTTNMTWKHNDAYSSYTVDAEYITNYWHVTITGVPSEQKHQISISAGTGGTVSPSGDKKVGATGITITANPNTGYRFKEWTVDGGASVGSTTSATTTLTATYAGTVTANFEQSSTPTPTPSNTDYAYYLIGNFMNTDGGNINKTNLIFRFNQTGANTYTFDVPATLNVNSQIYSISAEGVDTIYGPTSNTKIDIINNGSADYALAAYALAENSKHFIADDRGLGSDGMYTYTLTVNNKGIPTSVNVKHNQLTRVAYFLPDAPDATAQPAYSTRNDASSSGNNKYFGSVNLQKDQKCFVISNIRQQADNDHHQGLLYTRDKLYKQGNGGYDVINGENDGDIDIHKVYPKWADKYKNVLADGFTFGGQAGAYTLEYNPSVGKEDVVNVPENALIGGEVKQAGYGDLPVAINSINIVGTGITGSFDLSTRVPMIYNQTLKCYEYTFDSSSEESATNLFRFVANDSWAINWGEESTSADDHAKVPYQGEGPGHTAMPDDPNDLKQYNTWTAETGEDIIFNRPAGHWTIRFYIVTESTSGGNGYTNKYYYTINGKENNKVLLTYRNNKFIRTYSNDVPMNLTSGVKAYIAYTFEQAQNPENNYAKCKVYLRQMDYIPANVGVVLVGQVPADGGPYTNGQQLEFSLQKRDEAVPSDLRKVWTRQAEYIDRNDQWHNFLVHTVTAVNNLGNAKVNSNGQIIYRYFGLSSYYNTAYYKSTHIGDDYIGFFRLTEQGTSGANKAYLRIPSSAVVGTDGVTQEDLDTYGYLDFNAQLSGQVTDEGVNSSLAKAMIFFDDEDIDDYTSTGITTIKDNIVKENVYYNLQGIRVVNPSKGMYIFNGKKILVK